MQSSFRVGPWLVEPRLNTVSLAGRETRVEPKVVEVLVCLARHAGDVVSRDTLIAEVWRDTFVSDAALTRCIAELRKVFDDDVKEPRVIQTIAKQGYRLIAPVSDGRGEAEQPEAPPKPSPRRNARLWLAVAAVGVAAGIAAGAVVLWLSRPAQQGVGSALRFSIPLRGQPTLGARGPAISRNGARLAYAATESGKEMIYLRPLDSADAAPVPGTEGGSFPFLSPDGAWLGFVGAGHLKKVSAAGGGAPVVLCRLDPALRLWGASWTNDGWIVYSEGVRLIRVRDSGGAPEQIGQPGQGEMYRYPSPLPGDTHIVFTVGAEARREIAVAPIAGGERKTVVRDAGYVRYSAGHLLYFAEDSSTPLDTLKLYAVPFDSRRLEVQGNAVMLIDKLDYWTASESGTLVYSRRTEGTGQNRLVWVGRDGTITPLPLPAGGYHQPALSPDGRRIAVTFGLDTWIYSIERETFGPLTFGESGVWPIWTPDGQSVVYTSRRGKEVSLIRKRADGTGPEERLTSGPILQSAMSFSFAPGSGRGCRSPAARMSASGASTARIAFSMRSPRSARAPAP